MTAHCLVVGAGAFGTAIAKVLSENFDRVSLLARSIEVLEGINRGENTVYLKGEKLPSHLRALLDWPKENTFDLIVNALPMKALYHFYKERRKEHELAFARGTPLLALSKGIDNQSFLFGDDLFRLFFPQYQSLFLALSGPSFARELAEAKATIVSLAGAGNDKNEKRIRRVQNMLETSYLKCVTTSDLKGVLVGGALKNVLAIGSGIIEGLGPSHNTRAALLTQGIDEMLRFGEIFGAQKETFYGPSGMGDLILSTTGEMGRNKSFGLEIGRGANPEILMQSKRSVVEGYGTTMATHKLCQDHGICAPILNGVYEILYKGKHPSSLLEALLQ